MDMISTWVNIEPNTAVVAPRSPSAKRTPEPTKVEDLGSPYAVDPTSGSDDMPNCHGPTLSPLARFGLGLLGAWCRCLLGLYP